MVSEFHVMDENAKTVAANCMEINNQSGQLLTYS